MSTMIGSAMQKIFGTAPVQQPQQQQLPTPGNIPATNMNPADANNPTVPASSTTATNTPAAPLDAFADIWQTPAVDPKAAPQDMFANVTQASLSEAAKKNDFTKVVTPEMMQAIAAGGEGAVQATLAAMNAMAQKNFADSAYTTTQIVKNALEKQKAELTGNIPSMVKAQTVSENLRNSNPIFNHAATAPIMDMFQKQAAVKFPNATASELQAMAQSYLADFVKVAQGPEQVAAQTKTDAATMDWSSFLE